MIWTEEDTLEVQMERDSEYRRQQNKKASLAEDIRLENLRMDIAEDQRAAELEELEEEDWYEEHGDEEEEEVKREHKPLPVLTDKNRTKWNTMQEGWS